MDLLPTELEYKIYNYLPLDLISQFHSLPEYEKFRSFWDLNTT